MSNCPVCFHSFDEYEVTYYFGNENLCVWCFNIKQNEKIKEQLRGGHEWPNHDTLEESK